ncbi:sulfite exporter TauE/SafE family protein [Streptomyces sp. NBC_01012]|uniref:sulfite exporter TauE/SafE family protein n=1 Tax=Streptomyces sp. NBC_01012 TaxID=2903717 RepID=UPI002F90CBE2|nr:sulfite exporter TauE/SafE family protein [Streptomyces sp. NBC_01012]
MAGLTTSVLLLLGLIGLLGGIGITALGPGGVLPTIGLFALTDLTASQVAGTAIVTHVATGALATCAYARSGQFRDRPTLRTALLLAATAAVGTPLGVMVNAGVSKRAFGAVLGVIVALVAALVWYREYRAQTARASHPPVAVVAVLGLAVSMAAGIIGVGGPMLTVPLLIALGVPLLQSLAAAQAQSVVIATIGTVGYLSQGAINWPLALVVGIPELAGVLLGWKIARTLPTRSLKKAMVLTLATLSVYLVLHG